MSVFWRSKDFLLIQNQILNLNSDIFEIYFKGSE